MDTANGSYLYQWSVANLLSQLQMHNCSRKFPILMKSWDTEKIAIGYYPNVIHYPNVILIMQGIIGNEMCHVTFLVTNDDMKY